MKQYLNIPTAVANRSHNDLSGQCITTTGFFTPRVIYTKRVIPGSHIKYNVDAMTRALAMFKPAYADIETHIRAFFVPYRTIFRPFNAFITNSFYGNVGVTAPTQVRFSEILKVLISSMCSSVYTGTGSFDLLDNSVKYRFTWFGRYFYNFLISLGYEINTEEYSSTQTTDEPVSALPLISLFKVMYDYYLNPQDSVSYKQLGAYLESFNDPTYQYLSANDMISCLQCMQHVNYDLDYFTSSTEEPNGPISTQYAGTALVRDPQLVKNSQTHPFAAYGNNTGPEIYGGTTYNGVNLTQFLDSALHRIADMFKRYQLTGVRPLDRYFAQRGIKLENEKLNRCSYLGTFNSIFQITDQMSAANTFEPSTGGSSAKGDVLGDYSGKAINYNLSGKVKLDADEFGQVIFICTIVPKVKYYQGVPRELHSNDRYSFFTPEFDDLGVQAIRADELINRNPLGTSINSSVTPSETSIGFTGRYADLKTHCKNILSGDFALATRNAGMDSWYVWRSIPQRLMLNDYFKGTSDSDQYQRIFNFANGEADPFISVFNVKADASLPCAGLFEDYDWSDQTGRSVPVKKGGTFEN